MPLLTFVSDLHIDVNGTADEFVAAYSNYSGYLAILGDFCEVGSKGYNSLFFRTFQRLFETNPNIYVIFLCGNHEYYGSDIKAVDTLISDWVEEKDIDRFFFLSHNNSNGGERLYVENTLFIGGTLWYPEHPDIWLLQNSINDFSLIADFKPEDAVVENSALKLSFCDTPSTEEQRVIWLTHHAPSYQSVSPIFQNASINCYFVDGSVEKLIQKYQPHFVLHGHCHNSVQYQIGKTLVASNPYGYGNQNSNNFDYFKYFLEI
jgi:UDP-2,3-diacylglucosamine pyrophosphatase LpxH